MIRARTGLQSDGTALAGQAFGGKNPKLRLNRLQTESEQNIQAGVEQLLRGMYQAFRNPRSHGRPADTQADTDAIVIFVNYLIGVIGHAKAAFSLDACVDRVLEQSFVPNARYANLLVAEIPAREKLQVALTVYQRQSNADGQHLRYFFDALLPQLSAEEQVDFFAAVSTELRETNEDSTIRTVFQALDPTYWSNVDEVARIRVENRIIRNADDGRYDSSQRRCLAGAHATWTTRFLEHFTLKDELMNVLVRKLRSNSKESQDYVFEYFFQYLDSLDVKPPLTLNAALIAGLKAGDVRFLNGIKNGYLWNDEAWTAKVLEAIDSFKPVQVPIEDGDEEVPF